MRRACASVRSAASCSGSRTPRCWSTPASLTSGGSYRTPRLASWRSGGAELLLLGDTFVHPLQLLDPALVYESDVDPALAASTRGALVELIDRTAPLVAAAHFPGPGIGSVTTTAAGRVFDPSS